MESWNQTVLVAKQDGLSFWVWLQKSKVQLEN